jgi:integrase
LLRFRAWKRKAREIIEKSGADKPETLAASVASIDGVTFRKQADEWMVGTLKQDLAPSTLTGWQSYLDVWILPALGDLPLSAIKKTAAQGFIDSMDGKLEPKTIANVWQVVPMVFASATNEDGDELYPRNWRKMVKLPKVIKRKQNCPCFTKVVMDYLANSPTIKRIMRMLFILCGATGLRIGEALGIRIEHVLDGGTRIRIVEKAWQGQIHDYLKTENGDREVDLDSQVAKLLMEYIGTRKSGLVFCSRTGKQLWQSNILRRHLHPALKRIGFAQSGEHAFRRFRDTHLRSVRCPAGLIDYWLGWAPDNMPGHYDAVRHDLAKRKEEAEAAGVGFDLPLTLGAEKQRKNARIVPIEPKVRAAAAEKMAVSA